MGAVVKLCLSCGVEFPSVGEWACPSCNFVPSTRDGFPSFSRAPAEAGAGFDATRYETLVSVESDSFWFNARNDLISWALGRFFPSAKSFLEVGCGTGFVLSRLERDFPHLQLSGSEYEAEGLKFASSRVKHARLMQMDARAIPFKDEFDLLGAFDVLEHIDEDEEALAQFAEAVKKHGGGMILTVPQHRFLWSQRDVLAHHVRRYTRRELLRKVEAAGFHVRHVTSFVSFLLPALIASRLLQNGRQQASDGFEEFRMNSKLNKAFAHISRTEGALLQRGVDLRLGGSLLVVASL